MRSGEVKVEASSLRDGVSFAEWLTNRARRAALVVAHPAHEMRVLQWLSTTKARAHILTQGSRSGTDTSRRRASEQLIASCGGQVADWGGAWDRDLYQFVLKGDAAPFVSWTQELAEDFIRREVDLVVTDAWQYYNVAHDLTHVMARLAADRASQVLGRPIAFLDYLVVPDELTPDAPPARQVAVLQLNERETAAKRAAVARVSDVAGEAAEIEEVEGADSYAREVFREPQSLAVLLETPREKPLYEQFGEQRVQSNIYFNVIRWSHVSAICQALVNAHAPHEPLVPAQ
jgi:hypothetical protein